MSSFLCFICHSTVNADTNEEMREKYREIVGMNLCPDSHLCHICCHVMNRLWLFRSVCLKRSLEYPVLFSEKGTLNLQRNDLEIHSVCSEDCEQYKSRNINSKYFHFTYFNSTFDNHEKYDVPNDYVELEDERQEFDELENSNVRYKCDDDLNNVHNVHYRHDNDRSNVENDKYSDAFNYEHNDDFEELHGNDFMAKVECTNNFKDNEGEITEKHEDLDEHNEHVSDEDEVSCEDNEVICDKDDTHEKELKSPPITEKNYIPITETDIAPIEDVIGEGLTSPQNADISNIDTEYDTETLIKKKKKKKKHENGDGDEIVKKKHKSGKETKRFDKFLLSVEEQRGELEAKRRESKYIEAEFKCYNCALGFLFKDTYQAHMMRHEESNGEHLCLICGLRFATTAVLRAHTALHAERHRCLRCGTVVRRRHRGPHAKDCFDVVVETASCHLCGNVYKDSTALQQHVRRFHQARGARAHACSVCGQRCADAPALRNHMIAHVGRRFPCGGCARTFRSPASLRAHRPRHAPRAPALCACGASLASQKDLRAHLKRSKIHAHASFECPTCGRLCPSAASLRAHGAVHAARALSCPSCHKRVATRAQLARHVRAHDKPRAEPRALCHLCGASFKGNNKLNRHLREVCEKDKLEEELSSYYAQAQAEC